MKNSIFAAAGLAALLFAAPAFAQEDFSKVEIKTTDLGHNTYMLEGQGGNITLVVGTDGVIMFDSQFLPLHDRIRAAIAKITNLPVRYVIDPHYHNDHTNGNPPFAREGAVIVAQENVKPRILARQAGFGPIPPAMDPAGFRPSNSGTGSISAWAAARFRLSTCQTRIPTVTASSGSRMRMCWRLPISVAHGGITPTPISPGADVSMA